MTIKDYIDKIVSIGYEWAEHELSGNKGIAIRKDDNKIFDETTFALTKGWDDINTLLNEGCNVSFDARVVPDGQNVKFEEVYKLAYPSKVSVG